MKIRATEMCCVNLDCDHKCLSKQLSVSLGSNFSALTLLTNLTAAYQPPSWPRAHETTHSTASVFTSRVPRLQGFVCACHLQSALVTLVTLVSQRDNLGFAAGKVEAGVQPEHGMLWKPTP